MPVLSMSATCQVPASIPVAANRPATLSRRSAMALSIRLLGAGGMFFSHVILVRSLGVAGFGEYALAITWLQMLAVLGKLGLDNTSLRYVSEYVVQGETGKLRGFVRDSTRVSLLASMAVMIGLIATVLLNREALGDGLAMCLIIASAIIPLLALRQIQEASLRGAGHLVESQISTAVWPWILCGLAGAGRLSSSTALSSRFATLFHLCSMGVVSGLVYYFLRRSALNVSSEIIPETRRRQWLGTAMAFLIAELFIALKSRACVALAGIQLGGDTAGLYAAMERFADISVLGSQSLGLVIAPQFAALYAAGRYSEMRRLMRYGQLLGLSFTIPVALAVAIFGDYLFALLGPDYREGWGLLLALLASACIASFSGPAAYVLQMTGRERSMLLITAVCALVNIVVSLVLMRSLGLIGLGYAQMGTSLLWTIGVRWSLRRHPAWQGTPVDSRPLTDGRVFP